MHYLAHSITKLFQGRKQWYEGWEGIPMYDDKATVNASLIYVIAVYGNKEEQPNRGNVWVSIITYSLGHLT